MGVPLFFVLSGYLLGGQVHAELDAISETILVAAFFTHLPCGVGRAGHFVVSGLGDSGINLTPGYGNVAAPVSVVDQLAASWHNPSTAFGGRSRELGFYLLLPLIGILVRHVTWMALLAGAAMITVGWRAGWFLATDTDNYLTILPVLDSLPGVLLTFILGFSLNFLPDQLSVTQRRRELPCRSARSSR